MEETETQLAEIKSWLSWICLWVFFMMLGACGSWDQLSKIANSLQKIEQKK